MGWNLGLLGNFPCFHVLELNARVFLYLGDQDQAVEVILFLLDPLLQGSDNGHVILGWRT